METKRNMMGFRPSEKALAILEEYMKQKGITSKSQAVNQILEAYKQPQPQPTQQTTPSKTEYVVIEDFDPELISDEELEAIKLW